MRVETYLSDGSITISYTGTLEENKEEVYNILRERLEESLKNGKFDSFLGFVVQNRRFGTKNDLQNVESLIKIGQYFFRDADDVTHTLTLEQMESLRLEMIQKGLEIYQEKFIKENLIQGLQTIEEVWNIID